MVNLTLVSKSDLRAVFAEIKKMNFNMENLAVQGNASVRELKKIKVALRESDGNAGSTLQSITDCKRIQTFKCKMYLPLKTYAELQSFEETLNGEVLEDFVNYLLSIGGSSEQKAIANIAQCIYSWELQAATTWLGVRDKTAKEIFTKHPLNRTKIPQLIADVCKAAFPSTTTDASIKIFRKYMMHFKDHKKA